MLFSLCVFTEKTTLLNFGEVTGRESLAVSSSFYKSLTLRTGFSELLSLIGVFPTASLTMSPVPPLGIVNSLVLTSSFVPKGSHFFL